MLTPKAYPPGSFADVLPAAHGYSLAAVRLDLPDSSTAFFHARLNGPADRPVWARAWLSTADGTLAETASPPLKAGDEVTLEVTLKTSESPQYAYMRIESAPLKTEHVVVTKLA
jgi:hypothetical protein